MEAQNNLHPIIKKIINAEPDTYIIFFVKTCPYCANALDLLRKNNVRYKGYDIETINGNMPKLLKVLNDNAKLISFDTSHTTKPIIFYNKKYLGGYDKLAQILK